MKEAHYVKERACLYTWKNVKYSCFL